MAKTLYKTKQGEEILSFLKSLNGEHVNVSQISNYFMKKKTPIGLATIYRHLDKLVDEGLVAKYIIDEKSGACFEYLGERGKDHVEHFHCKCSVCGQLIHMDCHELAAVKQHLGKKHGFIVDSNRTVIYGICDMCQRKGDEK
jgi:Fur family ferric uptake transcriptional regulator